jgi:hypothetical protein
MSSEMETDQHVLNLEEEDDYIDMQKAECIKYEGKIENLWEDDKYGHFTIRAYMNLPIMNKTETIPWTLSKIQFSWSSKYIRKNEDFCKFVKRIKERDVYHYDVIRKFCFENIEMSFHKSRDIIRIWRCDSNPFSENDYLINDEFIQVLEMMRDWMLKNTEMYQKSPAPTVLVLA